MDTIRITKTVTLCLVCLYVLFENRLVYRLLDKPYFVKLIRAFWALMLTAFVFFSGIGLLPILDYAGKVFETHQPNIPQLLKLFPHLGAIVCAIFCWRYFRYYFRNDADTIISIWCIDRHFDLNKRRKFDESYRWLQKASEIKPDAVHTWCMLASFNQLFLKEPEQADQHLAKAREILNSRPIEDPKETAIVECYFGYISQYRHDHKTAIECMKKAYELDPRRIRKREYEKALELAENEEASSDAKESEQ